MQGVRPALGAGASDTDTFRRVRDMMPGKLLIAFAILLLAGGCSNDPYPPEDGLKVVYAALGEDPHGLDPVQAGDTLSGGIIGQLYDALYEYHYLKRDPYELQPALAAAMPQVSDDGLTYVIPIKQGARFQDDPCFPDGQGREVTAEDFVYSIKRLADQGNDPRGWWLLQGKVVGLDAFYKVSVERAGAKQPMDYAMLVEGLTALDRYTLQIRLTQPFPQLRYALAMSYTAAVPHEAVEQYGEEFHNHPVGTGPFRLKEWSKRWRMILERNPTYRDDFYPSEGEPGDREGGLLDAAGQRLPMVDEVYFTVIYESQPAWLYFTQGYLDASGISKDHWQEAVTPGLELTPEFRDRGVTLAKLVESSVFYVAFNMRDPVVGTNRKLRQAMSLAYDTDWRIRTFTNGRDLPANGPIPPGIFGYDPDFVNPYKAHDLARARELLAEAGYPNGIGADGRRLRITYDIGASGPAIQQSAKAFVDDMGEIGIAVNVRTNTWTQFLAKLNEGAFQVFETGWILDYPDPENFLQLFYGPNKSPGPNNTSYDNPEFNALYEQMKAMEDTPERLAIIRRMVDIVVEDAVWIPGTYSVDYVLRHAWSLNAKPHGITGGYLKYRDVDVEMRRQLCAEWNRPNYPLLGGFLAGMLAISLVLALMGRALGGRGGA